MIPSIGFYKVDNKVSRFNVQKSSIVLPMLSYVIKHIDSDEFYIDISRGHNIYVTSVVEALTHLGEIKLLLNLDKILLDASLKNKFYLQIAEPILQNSDSPIKTYLQNLRIELSGKPYIEGKNAN